jgi:ParB-like chromosome segregation protein Spo0J
MLTTQKKRDAKKSEKPEKKRLNGIAVPRGEIYLIEPETLRIHKDPKHPLFDERALWPIDEKMVLNIMVYGVKDVLKIRRDGEHLDVVDGRQRVINGCEANRRLRKAGNDPIRVPCKLERGEDSYMASLMVLSNEMRRNDEPLTRAAKAKRLLDMGKTEEEVCITFGFDNATLSRLLLLLDCGPEIRELVRSGKLGYVAASQLGTLSREEQLVQLRALQAAGQTTTGDVARAVRAKKTGARDTAVKAPSKRLLRTLIGLIKEHDAKNDGKPLCINAADALRWVLGDVDGVVGLRRMVESIEKKAAVGEVSP